MKLSRPGSWPALAVGAAIASLSVLAARLHPRHHGSQTNASEAMDDVELRPNPTQDEVVDAGVKQSFPASDPPAVGAPAETAFDRKVAGKGAEATPAQPARRSPDWMYRQPRR